MVSRLKKNRLLYGFLVAPAVMILFVLYSALLGRSDPTFIGSFCADYTCECVDWFRSSVGYYQVENNQLLTENRIFNNQISPAAVNI